MGGDQLFRSDRLLLLVVWARGRIGQPLGDNTRLHNRFYALWRLDLHKWWYRFIRIHKLQRYKTLEYFQRIVLQRIQYDLLCCTILRHTDLSVRFADLKVFFLVIPTGAQRSGGILNPSTSLGMTLKLRDRIEKQGAVKEPRMRKVTPPKTTGKAPFPPSFGRDSLLNLRV
ncbi:MAG: hypothetical protein DI626_05285 [Micavibrio aeruginosavorus]|uniref:Uncharacterized protein n=1 Tax=Micavibrio aeruginosavorus TaxID=349221 RepID=A0A2W4ZX96_9BACT|nr:MAG: hypothetical protein DI626_05285 [Micavibrio aeruginosavorus]